MIPRCPEYDYENMPYLSPKGMRCDGISHKRLTKALFYETARPETLQHVIWSITQDAVYVSERNIWVPSAARTYVYATDEYDALCKLVGEVEQWEVLKASPWFKPYFQRWHLEWAFRQRSQMMAALKESVMEMRPGAVSAARTIIGMLDKMPVGRPKKVKVEDTFEEDVVGVDHQRVVSIFQGK